MGKNKERSKRTISNVYIKADFLEACVFIAILSKYEVSHTPIYKILFALETYYD